MYATSSYHPTSLAVIHRLASSTVRSSVGLSLATDRSINISAWPTRPGRSSSTNITGVIPVRPGVRPGRQSAGIGNSLAYRLAYRQVINIIVIVIWRQAWPSAITPGQPPTGQANRVRLSIAIHLSPFILSPFGCLFEGHSGHHSRHNHYHLARSRSTRRPIDS